MVRDTVFRSSWKTLHALISTERYHKRMVRCKWTKMHQDYAPNPKSDALKMFQVERDPPLTTPLLGCRSSAGGKSPANPLHEVPVRPKRHAWQTSQRKYMHNLNDLKWAIYSRCSMSVWRRVHLINLWYNYVYWHKTCIQQICCTQLTTYSIDCGTELNLWRHFVEFLPHCYGPSLLIESYLGSLPIHVTHIYICIYCICTYVSNRSIFLRGRCHQQLHPPKTNAELRNDVTAFTPIHQFLLPWSTRSWGRWITHTCCCML